MLHEYELAVNREALPYRTFVDTKKRKTTEHILPQDPEKDSRWLSVFGREHSRLVHSIANVVLTYDNSSYGREEYDEKRGSHDAVHRCYLSPSALGRERELGQRYASWTPEAVIQRLEEFESGRCRDGTSNLLGSDPGGVLPKSSTSRVGARRHSRTLRSLAWAVATVRRPETPGGNRASSLPLNPAKGSSRGYCRERGQPSRLAPLDDQKNDRGASTEGTP